MVRHQLGKFGLDAYRRRLRGVDSRNYVQKIGEPHKLIAVGQVQPPHSVVDYLIAYVDFLGQGLLGKMHYCTPDTEIAVELIVQVKAQQRFALGAEHRLVLQSHTDALPRIDYTLIRYGHYTHRIVNGIVAVLYQPHTSGHHHHRTARHVHGIKPDLRAARCLIFAGENKLVLIGKLSGHNYRGVIKFLIDILFGKYRIGYFLGKMRTERLHNRENHLARRRKDGVALDKVKESVGI